MCLIEKGHLSAEVCLGTMACRHNTLLTMSSLLMYQQYIQNMSFNRNRYRLTKNAENKGSQEYSPVFPLSSGFISVNFMFPPL